MPVTYLNKNLGVVGITVSLGVDVKKLRQHQDWLAEHAGNPSAEGLLSLLARIADEIPKELTLE